MLAGLTQRPGATDPVHFPEAAWPAATSSWTGCTSCG